MAIPRDVEIGGTYSAIVSQRLVPVKVKHPRAKVKYQRSTRYLCINLLTGRECTLTAAKLRKPLDPTKAVTWVNKKRDAMREAKERCRFCGKTEADCTGGGYDDGIPAHDFTPGGRHQ